MHSLEALTASVFEAVAAHVEAADAVDPVTLTFLLRRYRATDSADLRDALGRALALALDRHSLEGTIGDRAAWLILFADALALSDDDRLRLAAADLIASLLRDCATAASFEAAAVGLDACLRASGCVDASQVVPAAIDQLEHIVGGAYHPGEGIGRRRSLGDQIWAASVLLTGYEATGRLPYAMLAEELIQTTRRVAWDERAGGFFDVEAGAATKPFAANCEAARVLCRLAALHQDDEYRAAAVIAPDADYKADAERVLAYASSAPAAADARGSSMYGLALADFIDLH